MRPEILYPLFAPLTSLPGIGARSAQLIEKIAGPHVVDLLWHLPIALIDRRYQPLIANAEDGRIATITVRVDQHLPSRNKRMPYKVRCSDSSGFLTLVFFRAREDYLKKTLPMDQEVIISGKIDHFQGEIQISHPDYMVPISELDQIPEVQPVYGLTAGLTAKPVLKAIQAATDLAPDVPEWIDQAFLRQENWPDWRTALMDCHNPKTLDDMSPNTAHRRRLSYDELLANQLTLAVMRRHNRRKRGLELRSSGALAEKAIAHLPYALTHAQVRALAEINTDLEQPFGMMRLLQGDVGSGKTIVAFISMLRAVEAGRQAAIMAPTEILARQHFEFMDPLCQSLGLKALLISGRDKGSTRQEKLAQLQTGEVDIVIGTHALFQKDVAFRNLALAVIDEQHRFGVHQRLLLSNKGQAVDVLVMTATPIPRTLTLTAYGDMDVSKLDEKPPGRKPVATRAVPLGRLDDVIAGIRRALTEGQQIYWVCPLVEESDVISATAAEDRYEYLKMIFGDVVTLAHGRMKSAEKDAVMQDFYAGDKKILVATTVIEVGVDVPNASIMVIEHAERFGLAQLHQLRGRVGRGDTASSCVLLYAVPLGDTAKSRLKIMRETEDGFRIAEEDLKLRGSGDLLGTRQSGLPDFRLADINKHQDLLQIARDDAAMMITKDPDLSSDRGQALRTLLYLFEQDEAVRYLRAG